MEAYSPQKDCFGFHTIQVTLMRGKETATFTYKLFGNMFGNEILSFSFERHDFALYESKTVRFQRVLERDDLVEVTFAPDGNFSNRTGKFYTFPELDQMVQKIEIVEYKPEPFSRSFLEAPPVTLADEGHMTLPCDPELSAYALLRRFTRLWWWSFKNYLYNYF